MPEDTNTIVFSSGTWKGLNTTNPSGGHTPPNSTLGANLLWKKAQKNLKKKNTSDTINKSIPQRNPSSTIALWCPCTLPSREMSRHHWYITKRRIVSPRKNNTIEFK
jgi:hypothetical protein